MVNKHSVIIVDDEYLARDELKDLLARRHPDFDVIAEAANARDALALIKANPEITGVFLDIHIQTENERAGLDLAHVLQRLPSPPWIVFVTGHPQTAVEAFRAHPAHYLLKPLDNDRVDEALAWIRQNRRANAVAVEQGSRRIEIRHRIVNRFGEREAHVDFVEPRDIVCIVKNNAANNLKICLTQGITLEGVYGTIKDWERKYPAAGFLQIHRSHLVNLRHVRGLRPRPGENEVYKVALKEAPSELAVGPEYLETLREKMSGGWF